MKKLYKLIPVVLMGCASIYPILNTSIKPENVNVAAVSEAKAQFNDTTRAENEVVETKSAFDLVIENTYNSLTSSSNSSLPSFKSFSKAFAAYYQLEQEGLVKNNILTVVDFSLSSTQKRLWVIDMVANKVILNSLVSHGKNSGLDFATSFSNKVNSFQSSLGAYLTAEVYNGKHGLSLRLDGMDEDLNAKARERAVVMHGADYVSESFIKKEGRLGRSQGCPAVPFEVVSELIDIVKDQSVLYIYHSSLDRYSDGFKSALFS